MVQSYKQPGAILTLTAPYARATSGLGAKVGAIFGVSCDTVANGVEGQFETEGVHELLKTEAQAWAVGDKIYWNDSTKLCDTDSAAGMLIGVCTAVAANPTTTGELKLSGVPDMSEGAQAAVADLTMGTNITAATANGSLTDSSGTNPTEAQFNELAKELGTKINAILAALRLAGIIDA